MRVSDSFVSGFFEKCAANGLSEMQAAVLYELWQEKVASTWGQGKVSAGGDDTEQAAQQRRALTEQTLQQRQQTQQTNQQPQPQQPAQPAQATPPAQPQQQQPQQPQQPQRQGGLISSLKGAWDGVKAIGRGVAAVGNTIDKTVGIGAMKNVATGAWNNAKDKAMDPNQGFFSKMWNRSQPGMLWNAATGGIKSHFNGAKDAILGKAAAASLGLCKVASTYGMMDPRYAEYMEKQALMNLLGQAAGFAAKRLPGMMATGGKMLAQYGKTGFNLARQGAGMAKDWLQTSGKDYLQRGIKTGMDAFNTMKGKAQDAWQAYQANAPAREAASDAFKQKMHTFAQTGMNAGMDFLRNQGSQFMQGFNRFGADQDQNQDQNEQ